MKKTKFAALALAGAALLGACSTTADSDETTRDANGAIVEGGDVGVFKMSVGDCFTELPSGLVESMEAVPCAEPHYVEVYHVFDSAEPVFSEAALDAEAGTECLAAFETYVGIPFAESIYDATVLKPTQETWDNLDDRELVCMLFPFESTENTTGTAKGSGL